MTATRTISFRIYPSRAQSKALDAKHRMLRDLWNAALEERIGAWGRGVRISRSDQERALREIRLDVGGWRGLIHTHEAQVVLKRLDLDFRAFFRRLAAGQRPGFPRFRSADRFRGWGYKEHGNGFRIEMRDGWKHGRLRLYGVGEMRIRGIARTPGRILKADVFRDARGWQLSLVVETDCAERAPATGPAIGLDWGVADFATIAQEGPGGPVFEAVPNPRHLDEETEAIREKQRGLSALARTRKISRGALKKQRRALARRHARVAARRKDFLHKLTARIAGRHRLIVTEKLAVRNMTASARGTVEAPGRNVAQKAGLNRSILDTAPAGFLNMLRYKAAEAGAEFLEADTRRLKPSQRCPDCGAVRKKALSDRRHDCDACGCSYGRDEAAALTMLRWGLGEMAARAATPGPENGHPAGTVGASDPPLAA